jgi:hypothetical protein
MRTFLRQIEPSNFLLFICFSGKVTLNLQEVSIEYIQVLCLINTFWRELTMKTMSFIKIVAIAVLILTSLNIVGCGGGGGDVPSLSGTYVRAGIMDVAQNQSWAAVGEATYLSGGTGTLNYKHSAFGPIEGLKIAYAIDKTGVLGETISMPGAAGETTNGSVTADNRVMIVIDDDEDDGLVGLEVGIHLGSARSDPSGKIYHYMGYRGQASGGVNFTAYGGIASFNSDGSGQVVGDDFSVQFFYTIGDEGRLSVEHALFGGTGAMTSDKTVLAISDYNAADNVVGLHVGIKQSSGMSVSNLKGAYHLFLLASSGVNRADTARVEFDGAGKAVLSDFIDFQTIPGTYSVSEDGAFELITDVASWKGAVRENGEFFSAVDSVPPDSSMILGIAQW